MREDTMRLGFRTKIPTLAALSTAALALVLSAGWPSLAAGEITSDSLAEAVESAKTAADYEALAAYYRKLAEEQEARAKMHEKMLPRFRDFVKGQNLSSHCKNIIADARKLAGQYEAMAKGYEQLAKEVGDITSDNVVEATESAKTAADYEALAAYYRKLAEEQEARAKMHEKMLPRFRDFVKGQNLSSHCKNIIADARKLAGQYEAMAKGYEQLAKEAGTK
jgi:hypothetical protein